MITLDLTEEQAKMLLVVTGQMAGHHGSRGIYDRLYRALGAIDCPPDPDFQGNHIVVDNRHIEQIRTV